MMLYITLDDYRSSALIGVYSEERVNKTRLSFTVKLFTANLVSAFKTDSIEDAVDYDWVMKVISETCENSKFNLLESLVAKVAEEILSHKMIDKCDIEVFKLPMLDAGKRVCVHYTKTKKNV